MTFEEFIASAEREEAKLADEIEEHAYNLGDGILRALHARLVALESKLTGQPELLFHGVGCPGHTTGLPADCCTAADAVHAPGDAGHA